MHAILFVVPKAAAAQSSSSHSASDSAVYAQPDKVKSSVSQDVGAQNAGSSYERGLAFERGLSYERRLSPGINGQDAQPSPSAYRRPVPQPTEFGSSRIIMSNNQMAGGAGRSGAMHGQLGGFDENGLPLVEKGDCGACGQPITGQVVFHYFIFSLTLCLSLGA